MRRTWVIALFAAIPLWAHPANGQPRRGAAQIGVLCPTSCSGPAFDAFRQALAELGHRQGQSVTLLYREAEGQLQRLPTLARELVDQKVDVLFSSWGTAAPLALKEASATIPIVAGAVGDPVAAGLVQSLAKPGGNVTGLSTLALTLEAKRLELLREIEPRILRIAVLWDPDNPYSALAFGELERAASPLGIRLTAVSVAKPQDLDAAFAAIAAALPDALLVPAYLVLIAERERIVAFAAERRLPTVYSQDEFVEVGGLASYGIDLPRLTGRAAVYVDKILKGAKPAELPVEQPTAFRLTINLNTARALGLTIPPTLLARADEVIE
jgi:putative tryptophan/tyrosine transport system substrate-binding protein